MPRTTGPTSWFGRGAGVAMIFALSILAGCARAADATSAPASAPAPAPVPALASVPASAPPSTPPPAAAQVLVPALQDSVSIPGLPADGGLRTLDAAAIRREMRKARGRTLFVHLWASWCAPCREELPSMDRFASAARARGAVVLSISLDGDRSKIALVPILLRTRAPGLTAIVAHFDDPEQLSSLFPKSWEGTIPAMFAFDRAGRLKRSLIGEVGPADLDAFMAAVLSPSAKAPRAKKL